MKIFILLLSILLTLSTAYGNDWEVQFKNDLNKGKLVSIEESNLILEKAIFDAMKNKAYACECMRIAMIAYDYNPYSVIKFIYSSGNNLKIDQLCFCATDAGILKAIIAMAIKDAVTPANKPIYTIDEINQSQCLNGEEGLPYTEKVKPMKKIQMTNEYGDKTPGSTFTFKQ